MECNLLTCKYFHSNVNNGWLCLTIYNGKYHLYNKRENVKLSTIPCKCHGGSVRNLHINGCILFFVFCLSGVGTLGLSHPGAGVPLNYSPPHPDSYILESTSQRGKWIFYLLQPIQNIIWACDQYEHMNEVFYILIFILSPKSSGHCTLSHVSCWTGHISSAQ